jgi:hypothetical protein
MTDGVASFAVARHENIVNAASLCGSECKNIQHFPENTREKHENIRRSMYSAMFYAGAR